MLQYLRHLTQMYDVNLMVATNQSHVRGGGINLHAQF